MARASNTMWNKSGESGHPCFLPDFSRKSFSFSPLLYLLWVCKKMAYITLMYIPSIPTLVRAFIMNGCWILSNSFSASISVIIWFLTFVNVMYDIDWFVYVEASLWISDESHLVVAFFFFFFLFRATPSAYGGSLAKGLIGATAASLRQSHNNARSEPYLQPTPQLTATSDP